MTDPKHNFVSLRLCSLLAEKGLTRNTWAVYRQYQDPKEVYLVAPGLDYEGIYGSLPLPEGVQAEPFVDTPAYTLSDVLIGIPGFMIQQYALKDNKIATLSFFGLDPVHLESSLPDTAATMLLQVLEHGPFQVEYINSLLDPSLINESV